MASTKIARADFAHVVEAAQMIALAFVVSFLSTASGMIVGDVLRPRAIEQARDLRSPPIECGVSVDVATLTLAHSPTSHATPPMSNIPTRTTLRRSLRAQFFDFERSICDRAEAVRGDVLRCSYARADRR